MEKRLRLNPENSCLEALVFLPSGKCWAHTNLQMGSICHSRGMGQGLQVQTQTLGYKRASWIRFDLDIQGIEEFIKTGQKKGTSNEAKV